MKIRLLAGMDGDRVAELERLCNPQPWSRNSLEPFSHSGPVASPKIGWVVEAVDGTLAGYLCALRMEAEAEILILGIAPQFRRCGLGRNLLSKCCSDLQNSGTRSLFLELRKSNAPALALYHSLGFRETGIRKSYYADNKEDAVQMRKDF